MKRVYDICTASGNHHHHTTAAKKDLTVYRNDFRLHPDLSSAHANTLHFLPYNDIEVHPSYILSPSESISLFYTSICSSTTVAENTQLAHSCVFFHVPISFIIS